jgi:LysR family transcriptional regulator (chromosome initiation inhibitor)
MQGCRVEKLGTMTYRLLATSTFIEHWFSKGLTLKNSQQAPAVIFNRKDRLQHQFFEQCFGASPELFTAHYIPGAEQFLEVISAGYCYGMVPDWQSTEWVAAEKLRELIPGATVQVDLYWHCWNLAARPLQEFSDQLVTRGRKYLTT